MYALNSLRWKLSILFSRDFVNVQSSELYRNMNVKLLKAFFVEDEFQEI